MKSLPTTHTKQHTTTMLVSTMIDLRKKPRGIQIYGLCGLTPPLSFLQDLVSQASLLHMKAPRSTGGLPELTRSIPLILLLEKLATEFWTEWIQQLWPSPP